MDEELSLEDMMGKFGVVRGEVLRITVMHGSKIVGNGPTLIFREESVVLEPGAEVYTVPEEGFDVVGEVNGFLKPPDFVAEGLTMEQMRDNSTRLYWTDRTVIVYGSAIGAFSPYKITEVLMPSTLKARSMQNYHA